MKLFIKKKRIDLLPDGSLEAMGFKCHQDLKYTGLIQGFKKYFRGQRQGCPSTLRVGCAKMVCSVYDSSYMFLNKLLHLKGSNQYAKLTSVTNNKSLQFIQHGKKERLVSINFYRDPSSSPRLSMKLPMKGIGPKVKTTLHPAYSAEL